MPGVRFDSIIDEVAIRMARRRVIQFESPGGAGMTVSRRSLLRFASSAIPLQMLNKFAIAQSPSPNATIRDGFPSHPPELAREMVWVSHYDQKRVRELVDARPALARAAWDWGFGDWETALGAASHM